MNIFLSPFAPENLVSRDGFGRPISRQPAHSIWCLLTGFVPISAAASIYSFIPPYAIGSVPGLSGDAFAYRWRSLRRESFAGHHGPINARLSSPYSLLMELSGHIESRKYLNIIICSLEDAQKKIWVLCVCVCVCIY